MNRLPLPAHRAIDDAKPLLHWPRFAIGLRARVVGRERYPARQVIAEFMPPHRIVQDVLTVRCAIDDVQFELMREERELVPVVVRMEKTPAESKDAMRMLPSLARALLVFDHRARSGEPAAVAMVGLIDALAPRAGMKQLSSTNAVMLEADRALADVFGAVERWMEEGH